MGYVGFLIIYIFGGLTFLPLVLLSVFIHAYLTLPTHDYSSNPFEDSTDGAHNKDEDAYSIRSGRNLHGLAEKFQRGHEPDVASGYFAVCREYVPGGVNGRPPERTTPAGSVIAAESPSVYQSMYRSLFDRRQAPTLDPATGNGKTVKRARNVFYVVLRHGHLMLYENSDQVEVKYVISIEQYDVSIYSGEKEIPEGELWIKRNAVRLLRKTIFGNDASKPFFFFSENCSDKEDFYVALLQNQEQRPDQPDNPPRPQHYDPKLAIGLVQRLHSSEEQLQTRWMNAMAGRLFLALYQTPEVEDLMRKKMTKKIARAKKPAFLSNIILRSIDMGESAPQIINPRLKDLTIDGDCCAEMDVKYSGNFRLEIATSVRIDLGARFKAREVTVVMAVVIKKLNGHALIKFKPPPSNRVWVAFETMPDMEMSIEPIVSSRQVTYGFILRTIESRIREVLAETAVLPHWDDMPFTDTTHERFRGGIWSESTSQTSKPAEQTTIPDEAPEDEAETDIDSLQPPTRTKDERVMSMPVISDAASETLATGISAASAQTITDPIVDSVSTSVQKGPVPPKALRSRSFASAANPLLSMDNANVDSYQAEKNKKQQNDATRAMRTISNKSRPASPPEISAASAPDIPSLWENSLKIGDRSSMASHSSEDSERGLAPPMISENSSQASLPSTPTSTSSPANKLALSDEASQSRGLQPDSRTSMRSDKKQTAAAINAAAVAAKKWGWGVINRNAEQKNRPSPDPHRAGTPAHPIGRGQPLPPPGQPLPFPQGQRSKITAPLSGKRKPVPPPALPQRSDETKPRSAPPPPLPARRRQSALPVEDSGVEGLLVVEAPPDPVSEPASPDKDRKGGSNISDESLSSVKHGGQPSEGEYSEASPSKESDGGSHANRSQHDMNSSLDDESFAAWQNDDGDS